MNRLGAPAAVLASTTLRAIADQIDRGDLVVTKFSFADEDAIGVAVECVDREDEKPTRTTDAEAPKTKLARRDVCPKCNKRNVRVISDDEVVCLECNNNWRPGAVVEV